MPLLVAGLAFAGALTLIYPSAASWFSQYEQSQRVIGYADEVASAGLTVGDAEWQKVEEYNRALVGEASVGPDARVPVSTGENDDNYRDLLASDSKGVMARLRVASIDLDLPIYHGTSDATLQKGVGHLEGTALPIGGAKTHSVLTAHRGLASSTLFTHLDQVKVGDLFTIEVADAVLTYQVATVLVVPPTETETLYPVVGEDLVTLVTCTPLGVNSHRILVTGERILPTPPEQVAEAGKSPDVPGFPWWALALGGVLLLLSFYVWFAAKSGVRADRPNAHQPLPIR